MVVQEAQEQGLPDGAECFTTGGGTVQVQVEGLLGGQRWDNRSTEGSGKAFRRDLHGAGG